MSTLPRPCLMLLLLAAAPLRAEPPAPLAERAAILRVEMNRGPAGELRPFLADDAHPLSRWAAIRALGRIGDRGEAPALLAGVLEDDPPELAAALWAAGIARAPSLADPIAAHLDHEDPAVAGAAAEALGRTGETRFVERLVALTGDARAAVRAGALAGLAHLGDPAGLDPSLARLDDADPRVRAEARFAAWRLASRRHEGPRPLGGDWAGDPARAKRLLGGLAADDAATRIAHLRPLGILLPPAPAADGPFAPVLALADDPDPRVVQDLVQRVLANRTGPAVEDVLARLAPHSDPKVRSRVAAVLGGREAREGFDPGAILRARFAAEEDARLRLELAVALARLGDEEAWAEVAADPPAGVDPVLVDLAHARVLLAAEREGAVAELVAWAWPMPDPHEPQPGWAPRHALVYAEIASALAERAAAAAAGDAEEADPAADPQATENTPAGRWVRAFFAEVPDFLPRPAPYAYAHVVSLAGALRMYNRAPDLFAPPRKVAKSDDVRRATLEVFGTWAARDDCPDRLREAMLGQLRHVAGHDASTFVRRAAIDALEAAGVEDRPDRAALPANDWNGLPRPVVPVFGLPLDEGPGERLGEREICRLADRLFEPAVRVRFETTQGSFVVALDPDAAPVHCASLALAVAGGLYDDTRWHRVVPNFVIQGGDPTGTGAGGGGWTVPDEITRRRFVRGALGMPKSTKDDGGCQLFFMHSAYRPLDGRYTCYGRVVEGMETVDRIRVGDRILSAALVPE